MIEINLLAHREARRAAELRESLAVLLLGLIMIVGGGLMLNSRTTDQLNVVRAQVGQLESDISRYRPQEALVSGFKKKKSELQDKLDVIEGLDRARSGPVRMFDELATHTPDRLWLTGVTTAGGQVTLEGNSLDNGVVADFLRSLNGSQYFANVDLVKTGRGQPVNGVRLVKFEINADLVTPTPEEEGEGGATDA